MEKLLEGILKKGYTVEFQMGDDRWFYALATHPNGHRMGGSGKTFSEAIRHLCNVIEGKSKLSDAACTCGKSILGEIDADVPCPVEWHNPPRT